MDVPILNLSSLTNMAVFVLETSDEKRMRCIQTITKHKDNVQIVTHTRSFYLYDWFPTVKTVYRSEDYDNVVGSICIFDDCFANKDWMQDSKLLHLVSYPRLLGVISVFGFSEFYRLPPRMCWNLDLVCIGENPSPHTRKLLHESFFLYIVSYDEFCELLDRYTKENGYFILRREGTEDTLYHATC